jgi:hypothetical protein
MRSFLSALAILLFLVGGACPLLAANWIVDDVGDPLPSGGGTMTLRQAITSAEANPGPDTIQFQIPGAGPHRIVPLSQLPQLTQGSLTIDGFTQGGSAGAAPPATTTILIEIDGTQAGAAHGLWILSANNTIQGLSVIGFAQDGIRVQGTPAHTHSNVIYANFVGVDATGMNPLGNGWGYVPGGPIWAGIDVLCPPAAVVEYCHDNRVAGNLVADDTRIGIAISSCPPSDCYSNTVEFNFVGTDLTGWMPLPNHGTGVTLAEGTHDNFVQNNLISANQENGVDLTGLPPGTFTHDNHIILNIIGLAVDGRTPLGNGAYGISFGIYERASPWGFANYNDAMHNTIAYNGLAGVSVWEDPLGIPNADCNRIQQNSIYANGGLGIDLNADGVTPNDPGDPDIGPNQEQNFPQISSASWSIVNLMLTVTGTTTGGLLNVDVYAADPDPSGYGEGRFWLGSTQSSSTGNWSLTTLQTPTAWVTATATDGGGNTSEFSAIVQVPGSPGDDFGDAPDPPYPTLLSSNGARHAIWNFFWLDQQADGDPDGQPDPAALGDDNLDGNDDERGIIFLSQLSPGAPANVLVDAKMPGFLDAWIDFGADGSWAQPGDAIFLSQALPGGPTPVTLNFQVPPTAAFGQFTFARFRYSSQGGLSYMGYAGDGEVEDYMVYIGTLTAAGQPLPGQLVLRQNVPNPFNPTTRISFDLPASGPVELVIYSLDGRRVAVLADEWLVAGSHARVWDGTNMRGRPVAAGTYLCRLQAYHGQQQTIRITLVK